MVLRSATSAFKTPAFKSQVAMSMLMNVAFNILLPLLGKVYAQPRLSRNAPLTLSGNMALDILVSHIAVGALSMWAGTLGMRRDVANGKVDALAPAVLRRAPWCYTPAAVPGLLLRGAVMGAFVPLVAGVPFLAAAWLLLGEAPAPGLAYILAKGCWITFVLTLPVTAIVFVSAIATVSAPVVTPVAPSSGAGPDAAAGTDTEPPDGGVRRRTLRSAGT